MENKQNILLIDKNKYLREVVAILMRDEGYSVNEMQDGKQALEHLLSCKKDNYPSCIVMDGDELLINLANQSQQRIKEIPVVMYSDEVTGKSYPQVKARIEKPVSIKVLFSAIRGCAN